jgi:hypothetical protein
VEAKKIAITSAHWHNAQMLVLLFTGNEYQVFAEKAYDFRNIFNLIYSNCINTTIPLRKNFRTIIKGVSY